MSNAMVTEATADHVVWAGLSAVGRILLLIPIWWIRAMSLSDDADHLLERDTIAILIFNDDIWR